MIETLPEKPTPADVRMPAAVAEAFAVFAQTIARRSQIVWGEHCSECAYPSCYAHCAFYTPRSDFNCRRFEAGMEPVDANTDLHRVRFRKWGKLEGQGPTRLFDIETAEQRSGRDGRVVATIDSMPAPHVIKRKAAWYWNLHKGAPPAPRSQAGASGAGVQSPADAFVIEVWSSDGLSHPFTVSFLNTGEHRAQMFQASFEADIGYRRLTLTVAEIARHVDLEAPYLVQIEPVGEAAGVQVVFGICDFVLVRPPAVAVAGSAPPQQGAAKPAKVVVWDLDETLWTGVLVEDGARGVKLRPEAVAAIKMLDARGVLQSIASKNNATEALAALKAFGLDDYFLHPQIHWNPKSGSIAALARTLNLGLDSFVFIDDQPFERGEVESAHPMVRTLPHTAVGALAEHPWFDLPVTAESGQRRTLYRQEARRGEAFEAAGADYGAFLRGSEITLRVDPLTAADVERVFELSQRTNQLNFTGRKYAREQVQALLAGKTGEIGLALRCSDRFGDYGLIGFAAVDRAQGLIRELFMSCRVQRKRVEHAFMAWLGGDMAMRGLEVLRVAYAPTGRNGAALEMLGELGFKPSGEALTGDGETETWVRAAAEPIPEADIVTLLAQSAARAA
jgi:FkbH-like protein